MQEKDGEYQSALPDPVYVPLSSSASLLASRQFLLLILKVCPDTWGTFGPRLFILLSWGLKFLNLEDMRAGW